MFQRHLDNRVVGIHGLRGQGKSKGGFGLGKASAASFLSPKAPQGALDFAESKTSLTLTLPAQPVDPDDTVIQVSLEH